MEDEYIQQPRTPVVDALRRHVVQWLQRLRHRATLHTLFPDQYAHDPTLLPNGFPYVPTPVGQTLFLSDHLPYPCIADVWLKYYGRTPLGSLLWMIHSGRWRRWSRISLACA